MKDYTHKRLHLDHLVRPLLDEWVVKHQDAFYDISTSREKMSPALSKTRTYHLRSPDLSNVVVTRTESTQHIVRCLDNKLYEQFPVMKAMIDQIGVELFGGWTTMGRVFVTRLDPHEKIGRHVDAGHYFDTLHRFHIPLATEGARFCWDAEQQTLLQGELWMLNNSIPHWVENDGRWRTHLIFDAC